MGGQFDPHYIYFRQDKRYMNTNMPIKHRGRNKARILPGDGDSQMNMTGMNRMIVEIVD